MIQVGIAYLLAGLIYAAIDCAVHWGNRKEMPGVAIATAGIMIPFWPLFLAISIVSQL